VITAGAHQLNCPAQQASATSLIIDLDFSPHMRAILAIIADTCRASSRPLRAGIAVAALSFMLMCQTTAPTCAQDLISETRIGILAHDVPDLWSGFHIETDAPDVNVEVIFSRYVPFLGGRIQPALGANINTRGGTSNAYLDARWQIEGPSDFFFAVGLGTAIHNGEKDASKPDMKALGSRVLFHIPVEIGLRFDDHNSLSVYFEHTSNGYTQDFNEGLDRLGVRYGYRF
jgi:lipid A 3-O-deacylase